METEAFLEEFVPALQAAFGPRIWFCGLQGSRSRAEQREDSDIDLVVVLEGFTVADIVAYRSMLDGLAHREFACGFLGGRRELEAWDPADLVSLCRDTVPILGSLDSLMDIAGREAAQRAALAGLCALYHGCVHNMIYEQSRRILHGLLKQATFVMRALAFCRTGFWPRTLRELETAASSAESAVLEAFALEQSGVELDFAAASSVLFTWAQTEIPHAEQDTPIRSAPAV